MTEGRPEFFAFTKELHNGLQGGAVDITESKRRAYEQSELACLGRLSAIVRALDNAVALVLGQRTQDGDEPSPDRRGEIECGLSSTFSSAPLID